MEKPNMEEFIYLEQLEQNHILRNTKFKELQCEYNSTANKVWVKLYPSFNIANRTYNELGSVWTENHSFRVRSN